MKEIPLTKGLVAVVDDEDYKQLSQFKWYAEKGHRTWYAVRSRPTFEVNEKRPRRVSMHGQLLNLPTGKEGDHIDGNGLNNCRYNLRVAAHHQNRYNEPPQTRSRSGYKGVCWHPRAAKWMARIGVHGIQHYLGVFVDKSEAAKAYNEAAKRHFGQFAWLNPIDGALT